MGEVQVTEAAILRAMTARISDFKEQADSLTLEGVRRVLEKDLGLDLGALDVYKRFVKKCIEECFASPDEGNLPKEQGVGHPKVEEISNFKACEDNGESLASSEKEPSPGTETPPSTVINEAIIKKAVKERASFFKDHAGTITLGKVRRLLEDDLELPKHALDDNKKVITEALDEVMRTFESEGKEHDSERLDSEASCRSFSADDETKKPKKLQGQKIAEKRKVSYAERHKKQSRSEEQMLSKHQKKRKTLVSEKENKEDSDEDSRSDSSDEEEAKMKKAAPTFVYGKRVEHLKAIIKACGMNAPPSIYKRAKQVSESKRNAFIEKELEDILRKEGLPTNPSEKEVKAVKKRKDRAKELEGIDMNNIVSSSRRRTTHNFLMPPPPKLEIFDESLKHGGEDMSDEEQAEEEESNSEDSSGVFDEDGDDEEESE